MQLVVYLLFHAYAQVGPKLALAICSCTTVLTSALTQKWSMAEIRSIKKRMTMKVLIKYYIVGVNVKQNLLHHKNVMC